MKLRIIREKQQLRNAPSIYILPLVYIHEKKRIQTNAMFLIMSTWKKKTIFIVFVYPPDCLPQSTNKLNKKLAVDSLIKLDIIK